MHGEIDEIVDGVGHEDERPEVDAGEIEEAAEADVDEVVGLAEGFVQVVLVGFWEEVVIHYLLVIHIDIYIRIFILHTHKSHHPLVHLSNNCNS